jgi:1-pyrroline-5-carboxylate dehydrogenase
VRNDPFQHYAPGSVERKKLELAVARVDLERVEIPCIVGGEEVRTGKMGQQLCPADHKKVLADFHMATPEVMRDAIEAAMAARQDWERMPIEHRLGVFTKAAWLLARERRYDIMAATMMATGKTVWQAEIDAAVELIDFWQFGAKFAQEMYQKQVEHHDDGVYNRLEYRPLEGFSCAISPFNFAAIGGNLPSTPAIVGNTVVWKPASTAVLSNYRIMQLLMEAGLPKGVINFIPGSGRDVSSTVLSDARLSSVNFTGSTAVFRQIWSSIGENIGNYHTYPRIIGETGGKNFHLVHPSADVTHVVNNTVRGAFEYQGQKCSATSRIYAPKSLWPTIREGIATAMKEIKIGHPSEFDSFMTAVIDQNAFNDHKGYIEYAKKDAATQEIIGGKCDDSVGYFIHPTMIVTKDPKSKTMEEEIFGPVLTAYVYDDADWDSVIDLVDSTSPYSLTGSVFARDSKVIADATYRLRNASGNFYINDKCTGSIVGQQPFGGARASGTNDKAGWTSIYSRFVSMRTIKENFLPVNEWRYPHMKK